MKIDLNQIDRENFFVNECNFCGLPAVLVNPKFMGAKWTKDNLIWRSSIWDLDGNALSFGYKKFFNESEQPDLYPHPLLFDDLDIRTKLDGSLLICDYVNGQFNARTRGTASYKTLENAKTIDFLLEKHKKIFDDNSWLLSGHYSFLFEFYDPARRIVLDYGDKPLMWWLGVIDKDDYSYWPQTIVDGLAEQYQIERPKSHGFNDFNEIKTFLSDVKDFEGFAVYFNNSQNIVKLKSSSYLVAHRFKSNANIETVIDLFCEFGYPTYLEFKEKLVQKFDSECAGLVLHFCSKICDAYKEVLQVLAGMEEFVRPLREVPRKDAAEKILASYGQTGRSGICFKLLSNKAPDVNDIKKLLYQKLKS